MRRNLEFGVPVLREGVLGGRGGVEGGFTVSFNDIWIKSKYKRFETRG